VSSQLRSCKRPSWKGFISTRHVECCSECDEVLTNPGIFVYPQTNLSAFPRCRRRTDFHVAKHKFWMAILEGELFRCFLATFYLTFRRALLSLLAQRLDALDSFMRY
jgi:hypothetical protein